MSQERIPLSVLIVDDSAEDRVAYRRFLSSDRKYEWTIVECETLARARECLREISLDCVLLDFSLPDGDGIEFLSSFVLPEGAFFPFVLFLTGYGNEDVAIEAMDKGAAGYIPKRRVDKDVLCQQIHAAYSRAKLQEKLHTEQLEKDRLIESLQAALAEVDRLSDLLPICSHCKSIREDDGYWKQVETYFSERTGTAFSHGICPACLASHYGEQFPGIANNAPEHTDETQP